MCQVRIMRTDYINGVTYVFLLNQIATFKVAVSPTVQIRQIAAGLSGKCSKVVYPGVTDRVRNQIHSSFPNFQRLLPPRRQP